MMCSIMSSYHYQNIAQYGDAVKTTGLSVLRLYQVPTCSVREPRAPQQLSLKYAQQVAQVHSLLT